MTRKRLPTVIVHGAPLGGSALNEPVTWAVDLDYVWHRADRRDRSELPGVMSWSDTAPAIRKGYDNA